jgi:hypothetical protein
MTIQSGECKAKLALPNPTDEVRGAEFERVGTTGQSTLLTA